MLCSVIKALEGQGDELRLFVGSDGSGCLDEVSIKTTKYWYHRSSYRLITLFTYFFSQFNLFIKLLLTHDIDRNALIYMNTLLPFGAALYAKLTGRRLITHVHEISIKPDPLRWFLISIVRWASSLCIYVSDAHREALPIHGVPYRRIYNTLDSDFIQRAGQSQYFWRRSGRFNVLMLASLRGYKGVSEIVSLAERLIYISDIHFDLVVNEDLDEIKRYFGSSRLPFNLKIHPCTDDPGLYFANASLVLNLSRPDQWIETFGLTLLEAMAFGVPVIAPPVGGPIELVSHGCDGFLIDSRNTEILAQKVLQLAEDEFLCLRLSAAARITSARFSFDVFAQTLREVLAKQQAKKLYK